MKGLLNHFVIVVLLALISGCTGYHGESPKEYVKRSTRLQEFKKLINAGDPVSKLSRLSFIENVRIAINPDVQYSGLDPKNYKGSMLVVVLNINDAKRVFIALGCDKQLDESKQKFNYKVPFLSEIDTKIECLFISDCAGYSIYKDKTKTEEWFDNELLK
jgi:hypothetical protein